MNSSMKKLVVGMSLAAVAVSGCGARYVRSGQAAATLPLPQSRVTGHVLVVSIDGLRPDAIGEATRRRCSA